MGAFLAWLLAGLMRPRERRQSEHGGDSNYDFWQEDADEEDDEEAAEDFGE